MTEERRGGEIKKNKSSYPYAEHEKEQEINTKNTLERDQEALHKYLW